MKELNSSTLKAGVKVGIIFTLSIGLGIYARSAPNIHGVKGTVLEINENMALISKRLDLSDDELNLSKEDWLQGNYELILASPATDVEVGQQVKVIIKEIDKEEYPMTAKVKHIRLLENH